MSGADHKLKLAAVIGWPVAHSLSPKLHRYWLREYCLNGAYVPLLVRKEEFSRALQTLLRAGFVGANVTLPHKAAAFALAHEHDEAASATHAANLLLFRGDGAIEARNTDVYGFRTSVVEALGAGALSGAVAVVLGAGGAARAVVAALDQLGATSIRILNRSPRRVEALVSELRPRSSASLELIEESRWKDAAARAAILVNATSAGLNGEMPFALPLDPLPRGCVVCDLVYKPLETEFLKQARRRDLATIDGLGMLMHQAVSSFAAFFGQTPAVTPALRSELEQALQT